MKRGDRSVVVALLLGAFLLSFTAAGRDRAKADPAKGKEVYARCLGCHSLERNRTGPQHCGLFGRKAGTVAGYDYSKAMKTSGIVWKRSTLDRFLSAPAKMVPGTKMGFAGIKDPKDRANLIAYLQKATAAGSQECAKRAD